MSDSNKPYRIFLSIVINKTYTSELRMNGNVVQALQETSIALEKYKCIIVKVPGSSAHKKVMSNQMLWLEQLSTDEDILMHIVILLDFDFKLTSLYFKAWFVCSSMTQNLLWSFKVGKIKLKTIHTKYKYIYNSQQLYTLANESCVKWNVGIK